MTRREIVEMLLRAVLTTVLFFLLMSAACLISIERAERNAQQTVAHWQQADFPPGQYKVMKERGK